MVVSLAIVSMLMVAAVSVVRGLSSAERRDQAGHEANRLSAPLHDLLTSDLLHATGFSKTRSGYVLRTCVAMDRLTLEPRHLPAEVEYQVRTVGSRRWLVRIQGSAINGQDLAEAVCGDVKAFTLESEGGDAERDQDGWTAAVATIQFEPPGREPLRCSVRKD